MILNFKKVILHNFASYAHAEIDLANKGFCAVSGRNMFKKDNSYSNGSGKSFIWSGICFTLTGETIAGQHSGLKNLLNDEPDSYTSVEVQVDSDLYKITRIIAPKSDLHIIKNGVDVSGKGIRESEKKLGELLPDLTKDFIASTFIIGQGMPNAFSKFSPSGRKEILERLTKSDFMIEEVKQRVQARRTILNTELRKQEDSLLIANTSLSTSKTQRDLSRTRLNAMVKPDYASLITAAKNKIDLANAELQTINSEKQSLEEELTKLDSDYNNKLAEKTNKLDKINEQYQNATVAGYEKKAEVTAQISQIAAEVKSIESQINKIESIKEFCPTCGQKLVGVHKPSTVGLREDLTQKNTSKQALNEQLNSINTTFAQLTKQKNDYVAQVNTEYAEILSALLTNKQQNQTKSRTLLTRQATLQATISAANMEIVKLETEQESFDNSYRTLEENLAKYETEITQLTETISSVTQAKSEIEAHIAVLTQIDTLTKRDFRGHLLSNIINYLDKRAKDFSEVVFGTRDLTLTLSGNALDISYCGRMFDNLSGGERMRVDLILQLAIRDLLKVYLNTHANILILDEITDFLDRQSCAAVMKLIEQELNTVESVFIISHHTDELNLPIDTELKIIKDEDGISTISH